MNLYSGYWIALKELLNEHAPRMFAKPPVWVFSDIPEEASRQELFELLAECIAIRQDKTLALKLGQALQMMALGLLGLAVANCQSLAQMSRLLVRHSPLRSSGARLRLLEDGRSLKLSFFERQPPVPDYPFLAHELFFSSTIGVMRQLTKQPLEGMHLELAGCGHSRPDIYQSLLGVPVKANRDVNQLVIPLGLADAPLITYGHDPAPSLPLRLYEGLLRKSAPEAGFAGAVRSILLRNIGQPVNAAAIARRLNMSERTLRRRLADEGTSLRRVREELLRQVACRYLEGSGLSVAEIGEMLGYGEYANFRRTFLRWTGTSPAHYRRANKASFAQ